MKFLCLICAEKMMEHMPEADAERRYEEYREFTEAIRKSGHFIGVNRLLPPNAAATVRVRQDKVSVTDGPYAETKEQLGGYYLLDVGNLDEAIEAGSRCPGAMYGTIELRPIQEFPTEPQG
jgi:hypothetical protein